MAKKQPTIFVSHAHADRPLAEKLTTLLKQATGQKVFCSSVVGHMHGGKRNFDQLMKHLEKVKVCVTVMTPNSRYFSPWVAFEFGAAYLRKHREKIRLLPVCAHGFTARDVPSPFDDLHVLNLAKEAELLQLLKRIAKRLDVECRCYSSKVNQAMREVLLEAAVGSPDWGAVSPTLVGHVQESSPFTFLSLLNQAKRLVFNAGFNLNYIATTPKIKQELFSWLEKSIQHSVQLLIANEVTAESMVRLEWAKAKVDYDKCVEIFRKWMDEGNSRKLKLDIRTTSFIGMTVLGIDPDHDAGQFVLTPTIRARLTSPDRPHFWLSKTAHREVFGHYWIAYRELFHEAVRLEVGGESMREES